MNKFILDEKFKGLVEAIEKNTKLINLSKKNQEDKVELLEELLEDLREMNHLKKIQFLESKAAKNLDESSYSELLKLKSQLNGE